MEAPTERKKQPELVLFFLQFSLTPFTDSQLFSAIIEQFEE